MQNCILLLGGMFQAPPKGIIPRAKALVPIVFSSEGSQEESHRAGDAGQIGYLLLRMQLNNLLLVQSSTFYFALFFRHQLTSTWECFLDRTLGLHP